MPTCNICKKSKSPFILNNKIVCMTCDELIFDIEIECEQIERPAPMKLEQGTGRELVFEVGKKLSK